MYWKNNKEESLNFPDGSMLKPILGAYDKSRSYHAFGLGFFKNSSSSPSIAAFAPPPIEAFAPTFAPTPISAPTSAPTSIFAPTSTPISAPTSASTPISAPTSSLTSAFFSYYLIVYMLQALSSVNTGTDNELEYDRSSPLIFWSANRDKPVGEDATLDFTSQGELVLKDADGTPVWSTINATNTSSGSDRHNNYSVNAIRMEITVGGNLMLLNGRNNVVWQSFDQPTDTWLPNQRIRIGQGLTARISQSNLSTGIYHLSMTEHLGLIAFLQHSSSTRTQKYAEFDNKEGFPLWIGDAIEIGMEHSKIYAQFTVITPAASSFQYIVLEPNGHLTMYQVDDRGRSEYDILTYFGYDPCIYPEACGRYGVCRAGSHCICPEQDGTLSYFKQFNADIGCEPTNPLSCKGYHSFVELPNVTYFDVQPSFSHLISAENCRDECAKNCSCKAAVFQHQADKASGNCSLQLDELYSFISYDEEGSHTRHRAFVKVQDVSVQEKHAPQSDHRKKQISSLVPAVLVPSLFGGLVFAIFIAGRCNAFRMLKNTDDAEKEGDDEVTEALTKFSFKELQACTQNFQIKLGQGGFGSVFEGVLCNGNKVAVKRLDSIGQGRKEFLAEVNTIGKVDHFNLVKLIGYCAEKTNRLLVYEHMCNGSLDQWIFNQDRAATLTWEIRQKIIRGVAKGLEYLHEECSKKIIHFDIKPQNILLDVDFNLKISDFGLAKLIDKNQILLLTALKGTPGYLAPELFRCSNISVKVDIYSFGVVILETMCGQRNFDMSKSEPLVHILKTKAEDNQLYDFIDQRNENFLFNQEEALKMIKIGLWCLQTYDRRPSMSMVVKGLENSNMEIITNLDSLTIIHINNPMHVMNPDLSTAPEASILSGPR